MKVQQVGERHRKMEEQYREVCALFCENPKTTEPSVFFSSFHKFIEAYKYAERELERQCTEEQSIKKAKMIKAQNEKMRKNAAANARLAAEVVKRRRSELYDQNQNNIMMKTRPMSSAISLEGVKPTFDKLSLSYPRASSLENLMDEEPDLPDELHNNPLFRKTKLCSDSDPDILEDKPTGQGNQGRSLSLPINQNGGEFRQRTYEIHSPKSPILLNGFRGDLTPPS